MPIMRKLSPNEVLAVKAQIILPVLMTRRMYIMCADSNIAAFEEKLQRMHTEKTLTKR